MHEIEFEIKLNDEGRPYIDLPSYKPNPEGKFFALEMARYILQTTHVNMTSPPYSQYAIDEVDRTVRMLGQIGDEMARILWHQMKTAGEAHRYIGMDWDMHVQSIEERDAIPEHGIIFQERLYLREEGLKVFVLQGAQIFELQGGTTNDNWVELNGYDNDEEI